MGFINCSCRCTCGVAAIVASAILGVLAAFFQITGIIAVATVFLWVAFGIAVGLLAVLTVTAALDRHNGSGECKCDLLNAVLAGILGTILLSLVLLAVGIVATSVVSAILIGILVFFFALTLSAGACYVRELSDCGACRS